MTHKKKNEKLSLVLTETAFNLTRFLHWWLTSIKAQWSLDFWIQSTNRLLSRWK